MSQPGDAKSVFCNALDRAAGERAAYLDAACGGNAALRAEVERLLDAHRRAQGFLDADAGLTLTVPPAGGATREWGGPAPAEAAGTVVAGRYKLLEPIGEGGMGSVWLAQQVEPVKRTVAVKLIKAGMDSKGVLARFDAERQALALMDHPNIAKVLDAGATPDGRPFFVMELVKGVPITRYCDDRRLTARDRLALFVPVCRAVQHAHQKGVIHRDIKPSNVLVALYDDEAVPKVIDFGVAKAAGEPLTDKTLHTGYGVVVGTLPYMAPEQAAFNNLDVDTRADVYGLGALLYELLAGTPPFTRAELGRAELLEALRVIREQEPPRPSTRVSTAAGNPAVAAARGTEPGRLAGLLRTDLDWVVMKALDKDRRRRYASAEGFAADVERYLAGDAVQAAPPSAVYRLTKFVRRHRTGVVAAGVLLVLVALGVAGTTAGLVQAAQAKEKAATDRAAAEKQAAGKARALSAQLQRLLASADPNTGNPAGYTVVQMLDAYEPHLADELADQPEVEADLRTTVGRAYQHLDRNDKAEEQFRTALDKRSKALGPDHPATAAARTDVSLALNEAFGHTRRYPESEILTRRQRALELTTAAVDALRRAEGEEAELARALMVRGLAVWYLDVYSNRPVSAEAVDSIREGLAVEEGRTGGLPTDAAVLGRMWLIDCLPPSRWPERVAEARRAVEGARALHGDDHVTTAEARYVLAMCLTPGGEQAEAETHLRRPLAAYRKTYGPTDAIQATTPLRVYVAMLTEGYRDEDADRALAECPAAWDAPRYRFSTGDLTAFIRARACGDRGDYEAAEGYAITALEVGKVPARRWKESERTARDTRLVLAISLYHLRRPQNDVLDALGDLLTVARGVAKGEPPPTWFSTVWWPSDFLGMCLLTTGDPADDRLALALAARRLQELKGIESADRSVDLDAEYVYLTACHRTGEHRVVADRMPKLLARLHPSIVYNRREGTATLVKSLEALGRPADAEQALRDAVAAVARWNPGKPGFGADHPEVAAGRVALADFLLRQKRPGDAEKAVTELTEAHRILAEHPAAKYRALTLRRIAVIDRLAAALNALGKPAEAAAWRAKAPRPADPPKNPK